MKNVMSAVDLLEHIQDLHSSGWEQTDYQDEEAILQHPEWTLVKVKLSDLKAGSHHYPVSMEYANRKTEFPPIVVNEDGYILDGVHRYYAAQLRKDKTIFAYVPSSAVPR